LADPSWGRPQSVAADQADELLGPRAAAGPMDLIA
jgi:hypothetical protein